MIIIDKGVHLWTVQVERRDVQSIEAEVQPLLPHLVEGIHLQRLYGEGVSVETPACIAFRCADGILSEEDWAAPPAP